MGTTSSAKGLEAAAPSRGKIGHLRVPVVVGDLRSRRRPAPRRGMWVVLLGPDGVGKSSVIAGLGDGVAAGFAGCEGFHLRPPLHGRREASQPNCDPHGKPARGTAITAVKLLGLLVANWLAYHWVVQRRVAKGRLVVFDRYFPDALVDPKRYRIPAKCRWLVCLIAGLVPQPDLYILLDAPVAELLARKQEVPPHELERQRREYRRLMTMLAGCVIVNAMRPLSAVVDEVVGNIVERRLGEYLPASRAA